MGPMLLSTSYKWKEWQKKMFTSWLTRVQKGEAMLLASIVSAFCLVFGTHGIVLCALRVGLSPLSEPSLEIAS